MLVSITVTQNDCAFLEVTYRQNIHCSVMKISLCFMLRMW